MKLPRLIATLIPAGLVVTGLLLAEAFGSEESTGIQAASSDEQTPTVRQQQPDPAAGQTPPEQVKPGSAPVRAGSVSSESGADGAIRYTFDGAPSAPQSFYGVEGWDVQVHSRDPKTWYELEAVHAQHGSGCEPPDMEHEVVQYEDMVFLCRDHVMTSLNASAYGLIYLTPAHFVDFSEGEAVIRFDVSTFRSSARDWWDVWITPYEENLALPYYSSDPDLQGPPRNGLSFSIKPENSVCVSEYVNFKDVAPGQFEGDCNWSANYAGVLKPDKARRDAVEIRISKSRVRIGMPDYNLWWDDYTPRSGELSFARAVVQFGHHSYTPWKDGNGGPNTYHWDNISISPSQPFTILRAVTRFLDGDGGMLTFATPAPENARLRFSAIGKVKVNGRVVDPAVPTSHPEHFNSYFIPIPAGAQEFMLSFEADGGYRGPFFARDFTIWSTTR